MAGTFFAQIEGAQAVVDGDATAASGIKKIDDYTVSIALVEPSQAFLNVLAMPFGSIVPQEFAKVDTQAFSAAPVGTGPYVLQSYTPGQSVVLARNQSYWGFDPASAARIEMSVNVDEATEIQRVQTGALDIAGEQIPGGQWDALINDQRWAPMVHRHSNTALEYLAMDTSGEGPLATLEVRQAINHAIDKQHLMDIQNGRGEIAPCIFPTTPPGYNPDCHPYDFNQETARDLLDSAGLEERFEIKLYSYEETPGREFAEAIQQDLAEIGITASLDAQPFETLLETVATPHNAPFVNSAWFQDFPDPSDFIDPILTCPAAVEGAFNLSWYCNEDVDRLAAEARGEPDHETRLELYQEIEEMIMADAPIAPLRYPEGGNLISSRITFEYHPIWTWDLTSPRLAQP